MSRAYKDGLLDTVADLGGVGFATPALTEKLSGADLAQALLAAKNGDSAEIAAGTLASSKTLGNNAAFAGSPNSAALSGADQERFAGTQ
jgi:hypothetical protein